MSDGLVFLISIGTGLSSMMVGAAAGAKRGHLFTGAVLGLLGPLGWVIALLLPESGPRCPHCGGVYVAGAAVCKCCGREIKPKPTPQAVPRAVPTAFPRAIPKAVPRVVARGPLPKPPKPLPPPK